MKKMLLVWMVCVAVLLSGSSVTLAGDFTILHELQGDTVLRDGNNVTDEFIEATRDCQNQLHFCLEELDMKPAEENKTFFDGILLGGLGGIILMLIL